MNLFLSIDFTKEKGGISRVAHMIAGAIPFHRILSLLGKDDGKTVRFFNGNKLLFTIEAVWTIFFKRPGLIIFDHLALANILMFLPSRPDQKVVIFLHDVEAWNKVHGRHKAGLRKATLLLCNSQYTKDLFVKNNPAFAGKVRVCLPGGVPEVFKQPAAACTDSWLNHAPYCLFVSRLWKEHRFKCHYELIDAFRLLHERKESNLRLAIVGNGDDAQNVEAYIEASGLSDRVRVFTNIADGQLAGFYNHCLAFVFPSTREGFGIVMLEALFFGKPVVALKGQPAEEIISDGESGRLLDDNSPETLMHALSDMENNEASYIELGKRAKLRYHEMFTTRCFQKRFLAIINEP